MVHYLSPSSLKLVNHSYNPSAITSANTRNSFRGNEEDEKRGHYPSSEYISDSYQEK